MDTNTFNKSIETHLTTEAKRYEYVQFDQYATITLAHFKKVFTEISALVATLPMTRNTSLAQTKLEEAYMWIGKALRDDQLGRGLETGTVVTTEPTTTTPTI